MQRRELFKNLSKKIKKDTPETIIIRPPYFLNEDDFSKCLECEGVCKNVCDENIISLLEDKSPQLIFENGGCTYCDECAKVCPNDVLKLEYKKTIEAKIIINELMCLSWQKTMCFSCKDPCLDNAIDFQGMFYPTINQDLCTSCGFCIKYCPVSAIKITPSV
jgi:ferredoxin-type protein NapF